MNRNLLAVALAALLLGGCASTPAGSPAPSPRETAVQVDQYYALVQTAVLSAVQITTLSSSTKKQIAAASDATTAAVLAYSRQADNCFRDPTTGVVGNAPGKTCDQSSMATAEAVVWAEIGQVNGLLAAFAPSLQIKLPTSPTS